MRDVYEYVTDSVRSLHVYILTGELFPNSNISTREVLNIFFGKFSKDLYRMKF